MKKKSYLNYLNFSEELYYLKKETDIEDVARFFKYMERFRANLYFFRDYTFFIIDYSRRTHIVMTGPVMEICGFHARDWLDGGLDFVVDIFQKDDFRMWNTNVFPSTLNFLQSQPHQEHSNYVFEFTYRMRNKKGDLFTVLQKGSFLTDPKTNLPLYNFGIALNISPIKRDTSMVRVISKFEPDAKQNYYQPISTDYYYPNSEESLLTKREIEILLRMADGWSSKQIADKLNLSHNTVMNHRKNMLRKTNTKNVAELISYSIRNGII